MTTLYQNRASGSQAGKEPRSDYDGNVEPDTRIPPRARPVLDAVRVNGVEISEQEILTEAQNHPGANPGEAVRQAARALVVRELLRQEAERQGIVAEPQSKGNGRTETREDAAIEALIDRQVETPRAGEEECRRYFDRNADRFRTSALWQVRHILLAARSDDRQAREGAYRTAVELCASLIADPAGFSAAAATWSACSSKADGGQLGQISRGETNEAFEAALAEMRPGEICRTPVETPYGYHVIALDNFVEGRALAFDDVKGRIANWLEAKSWSRAVAQYVSVLAAAAEIEGFSLEAADGPLVQ